MSVSVMSKVMKHYPGQGGEYTLAICLADFANDDGASIFPSVARLAHNSRQSERTVQRQLKRMVSEGWLEIMAEGGGKCRATRYRISPVWIDRPENWAAKGDNLSPFESVKGDTGVTVSETHTVTKMALNGDTAVSPEPSITSNNNPLPLKTETPFTKPCATATDDPDVKADCELAEWMFGLVKAIHPNHKPPQWAEWRKAIRLMRVRDHRTREQIAVLFRWANQDEFWASNILSPGKLRKKWDTLVIKRKQQGGQLHHHHGPENRNCIRCHEPTRGSRIVPGTGWLCNRHIDEHEGAGHA
jgi:hypothetical protein